MGKTLSVPGVWCVAEAGVRAEHDAGLLQCLATLAADVLRTQPLLEVDAASSSVTSDNRLLSAVPFLREVIGVGVYVSS